MRSLFRVMGAAPPWGQSLLRSCLAAHSFPPPPPAHVLSALGTRFIPICFTQDLVHSDRVNRPLVSRERVTPYARGLPGGHRPPKAHHAGGGGGKECGLPRSAARRAEWAA